MWIDLECELLVIDVCALLRSSIERKVRHFQRSEVIMISVKNELPETNKLVSKPVCFVVKGKTYTGHYHDNGWFYNDYKGGLYMAQGPKAKCGCSSWDSL